MTNLPRNYQEILKQLKEKILSARTKAVYSVNTQLLEIYWEVGKTIIEQQATEGWGTKVIDRLSSDLRIEFPDMKGLSVRNLKYMRAFADAYPNFKNLSEKQLNQGEIKASEIVQVSPAQLEKADKSKFVQGTLAQLSWYHHTTLLDKVKDPEIRLFYIEKTIENGWSRNVMIHQIESELHKRQGKIQTNFVTTIAPSNSELVQQVFKDPYKFEFVYLGKEATERDLEDALTNQMTKFLLELGEWFAFMGRQYKIMLGEKEYYFDLLFYHTRLKRYIVIDLKIDEFKPEYKGKMEFYLSLADEQLKNKDDEQSIGLILCKTKDGMVVEYALRNSSKPMGIAEYTISNKLPKEIIRELPTVEELEEAMEIEVKKLVKPIDKKLNKLKQLLSGLKSEEVKEKLSPENTSKVFKEFVLPLKQNIYESLKKDVIPLFESFDFFIWTDSQGHQTDEDAASHLQNSLRFRCHTMKIEVQLHGFKKAGIRAFDINKRLAIQLGNYSYTCEVEGVAGVFIEKLYHQIPEGVEVSKLAEVFAEWIVEDIYQRIEQLNNSQ
ncbi:MAG: PDDEXK nuclease domain-containing protein [Ignavibacterium sp.]|jgi:predicted nuclease of restriction endonuclease-like (RecB) superfamily|nr:PDDEXK nuclease domain-containing protein [Ignavibacterium sp.]